MPCLPQGIFCFTLFSSFLKMHLKHLFLLFLLGFTLLSCNSNCDKRPATDAALATIEEKEKIDFSETDSVEVIYYPQPQNQKEFETFFIKDSLFINVLTANLATDTLSKAECAHQVKLYLFRRGEVYKTVYAALQPECSYLAFAVNGKPQFYALDAPLQQALHRLVAK